MNREEEIEELKKEYFELVEKFTPEDIKNRPFFDLDNNSETEFTLTKDLVEKLKLDAWLANYKKEAEVSTGGIRGPQNVIYPWDTRFPINQIGMALATLAKGLVLKEDIKDREINKIAAGEVRYNTKQYVELIARIQAKLGIRTHLPFSRETTPVWMVSFLAFMLDYDGAEFVTSSHAISSKTATKDLDSQGNSFLPEMSLRFVDKIEKLLLEAKSGKDVVIKLSRSGDPLIVEDFDGYDMYADYLRKTVASDANLNLIREQTKKGFKLMYDTVGGCMYKGMKPILEKLSIIDAFDWRNKEEDPFFHGIGKIWKENPKTGKKEFFDLSCDFCTFDVVKAANLEKDLKDKPLGYVVLITDPDGDRLVIGQVESKDRISAVQKVGANYINVGEDKIFTVYHPTYSFFLVMDYYARQLREAGTFDNHPRFIVTTTCSSKIWDEWAEKNGIKVVTVKVGMKDIAHVLMKVENRILNNPGEEIVMDDIYGEKINLGKNPRMIFGGEESGGMITGLEDFVSSKNGRKALGMRQKSAGEASIIATALAAYLYKNKKLISEYLEERFKDNDIKSTFLERADITYYNESEPDPARMAKEKADGERIRDELDTFYLSLLFAFKNKEIDIGQVREVLSDAMPKLNFSRLQEIKFAGDSTFFQFDGNMFAQIRRSGTDAKMRGHAGGSNKKDCLSYLDGLVHYSGRKTDLYKKIVPGKYQKNIYPTAQKFYQDYLDKK